MHLEPLAFAANVTQATVCRIDMVLLTFGFLMMQYKSLLDPEDIEAVAVIIDSIERRWVKCDQEIFIATVVLNPFYKTTPFSCIPALNNANIRTLLECLYVRFFCSDPPPKFNDQLIHYLQEAGEFNTLRVRCERAKANATLKV
ncbi:hypothetical protein JVU11DRAFT_11470 [Chiua virens]|nr:hypothetical protein JVU11DRAFT_11470 [Chiua virens]